MLSGNLLARATRCLRGRFGAEFPAPYWPGKVEMAHCLLAALHVPQQETFLAVDELERRGAVRFEGPPGLSAVGEAPRRPGGPTPRSGEPEHIATGATELSLTRGVWRIDPRRSVMRRTGRANISRKER